MKRAHRLLVPAEKRPYMSVSGPDDPPEKDDFVDLYPPQTDLKIYGSPSGVLGKLYSRGKDPPTSIAEAARRKVLSKIVSQLEQTQLDAYHGALGPTQAARAAFWKINEGWRHIEAWAGPGFTKTVVLPPKKPYEFWLDFSERWKRDGHYEAAELQSAANTLQMAQNAAQEHGFPGIYHADRQPTDEHYGSSPDGGARIDVPSIEETTGALQAASEFVDTTKKLGVDMDPSQTFTENLLGDDKHPKPFNPFSWPKWAKVTGLIFLGIVGVGYAKRSFLP